jgi:signal-transduction protein with cAMP-binding, CBS, and nucleotidyltransferase domain
MLDRADNGGLVDEVAIDPAAAGTEQPSEDADGNPRMKEAALLAEHNTPGEGMWASAPFFASPKTWAKMKEAAALMKLRMRRKSAGGMSDKDELQLVKLEPETPEPAVTPDAALRMLGKITWFQEMSNTDLRRLLGRARLVYFPSGTNIIREFSHGTAYYLLLQGLVLCHSKRLEIDVALSGGAAFGEAALAPECRVRREANVVAMEDTWCLRLTVGDLDGLKNTGREEIIKIFYAKLLAGVRWFDMLAPSNLMTIAKMMELETFPPSRMVFSEGDVASKMYIVVSGVVGIFKEIGGKNVLLAQFTHESKSPWFGETALFAVEGQPTPRRGAGAFSLANTQLLSVDISKAKRFIEAVPEFAQMNAAYQKAYNKTNQLKAAKPIFVQPKGAK